MFKITKRPHYTPIETGILLFFVLLLFLARCQIHFQSSEKILSFLNRKNLTFPRKRRLLSSPNALIGDPLDPPVKPEDDMKKKSPVPVQRLFQLLEIADRRTHRVPSCVRQALVLTWLFKWFGLNSDIRIGVRRLTGQDLEAHIWLEIQGVPLQSSSPASYQPLSKIG